MVVWEECVTRIQAESKPRDAFTFAEQLKSFNEALLSVKTALDGVKDSTLKDTGGRAWTGPAGEAYRGHLEKISKYVQDLHDRIAPFHSSIERCATDLSDAYAKITVPLFYSKDLPGGTDAGAAVDNPNQFAELITTDRQAGSRWYGPEGFKARALEVFQDEWYGMDGAVSGSGKYSGGNSAKVGWNDAAYDGWNENHKEAVKKIGWWWDRNNGPATAAYSGLTGDYNRETGSVSMGPPKAELPQTFNTQDTRSPFDPGGPGGPGGLKPSAFTPPDTTGPGGFNPPGGDNPSVPGSTDPPGFDPPGADDPGSGLAGAGPGGGLSAPGVGSPGGIGGGFGGGGGGGLGNIGSGGLGSPGGLGGVGAGGIGAGRAGAGGVGAGKFGAGGAKLGGGIGAGGIPGLVGRGSSSAGPMRSPMPGLTDPAKAMRQYGSGTGAVGMAPGMTGSRGYGGALEEDSHNSWLVEDDDVWSGGEEPPPGVLA